VFGVADGQAEGTAAVYIEIRSCQGELLLLLLFFLQTFAINVSVFMPARLSASIF